MKLSMTLSEADIRVAVKFWLKTERDMTATDGTFETTEDRGPMDQATGNYRVSYTVEVQPIARGQK